MQFELLTLSGVKWRGEAASVQLTTVEGQMGILPHHEPFIGALAGGPVVVRPKQGESQVFASYGGLLEVTRDHVRVLADEADLADDLVESEIEAALKRARELRAAAKDKAELADAEALVDREQVRLGVARLARHRRPRPGRPGQ